MNTFDHHVALQADPLVLPGIDQIDRAQEGQIRSSSSEYKGWQGTRMLHTARAQHDEMIVNEKYQRA